MSTSTNSVIAWSGPSMGGRLSVAIAAGPDGAERARSVAATVGQRVNAWAARLTRFDSASDLSRLNASDEALVSVRPTLGSVLEWAALASARTNGVADATLLGERLAAQHGPDGARRLRACWQVLPANRTWNVLRGSPTSFDLDGFAKGWLADRAADLLSQWPGAAVDADGDVALRAGPGVEWLVDVADPRATTDTPLATLRVAGGEAWSSSFGVATSGTSVHRWRHADGTEAHHLIDPRTRQPAETDIVQATVIAPSAREAEVIAKAAVILGSKDALGFLGQSAAHAALLLLESGEIACLPGVERWLA